MYSRLFMALAITWIAANPSLLAERPAGQSQWPQWRGPNRDGVSLEKGLAKKWPTDGPPKVWEVDHVGVGYSSVAVADGRIFTQGDLQGVEHIIALSAKDGSLLWAVLPEPVKEVLEKRVADELKKGDKDNDGRLDEAEALGLLGWNFNRSDATAAGGSAEQLAAARAASLFKQLDANSDGNLTYAETGPSFRESFAQIDQPNPSVDAAELAKGRT
jgi:hypothetical protein